MDNKGSKIVIEKCTLTTVEDRTRLSDLPAGTFKTITSRKAFKKAIKAGLIYLNANLAFTADYINTGDTITIYKDETVYKKPSISIPIEILIEDDYLAIINKPAGIEVSGNKKYTVENALPLSLKESLQKDALERPLPAHRLDYPTSGCLLIAKTSETLQALHLMFRERTIAKKYLAVTIGRQVSEGEIKDPIDGKPSHSSFTILQTIPSKKYGALNLVELTPHTGRRHQLRRHMAAMGNPIFGEKIYGNPENQGKGNGLYLQAISLKFVHPKVKSDMKIAAPIAKKFNVIFPKIDDNTMSLKI